MAGLKVRVQRQNIQHVTQGKRYDDWLKILTAVIIILTIPYDVSRQVLILEEYDAFIFMVSWRWKQQVSLKHWYLSPKLYCATLQMTGIIS
jgi:hypothetical protein